MARMASTFDSPAWGGSRLPPSSVLRTVGALGHASTESVMKLAELALRHVRDAREPAYACSALWSLGHIRSNRRPGGVGSYADVEQEEAMR